MKILVVHLKSHIFAKSCLSVRKSQNFKAV